MWLVKTFPVARVHNDYENFIPRRILQKELNPIISVDLILNATEYMKNVCRIISSRLSLRMNIKKERKNYTPPNIVQLQLHL